MISRQRDRLPPSRRELIELLDRAERCLRIIGGRWEGVPAETRARLRRLADRIGRMLERCGVRR